MNLCETCLGCIRLEDPNFRGMTKCENYIDGEDKWNVVNARICSHVEQEKKRIAHLKEKANTNK